MDYTSFHNILPLDELEGINNLVTSERFEWVYIPTTSGKGDNDFSFVNLLYNKSETKHHINKHYDAFKNVISKCCKAFGEDEKNLIRARLGLIPNYGRFTIHSPHIDFDYSHTTLLLYLNQSDGGTYFYNNKQIVNESKFEQNKCIKFDGSLYHSSSSPIDHSIRIALNINLKNEA